MKKFISLFVIVFTCLHIHAQVLDINLYKNQIDAKAKTLCKYIEKVGTSSSLPGGVSSQDKDYIIQNKVPQLFWNYRIDPRYMKTTNGVNGSVVRKRPMNIYFSNLKRQSESSLTKKVMYDLRYEGIVNDSKTKGLSYEKTLSDGSKLYYAVIRIKQTYHQVTLSGKDIKCTSIEKTEADVKEYKVYVIVKPNNKVGIFLGDVCRAYRVN